MSARACRAPGNQGKACVEAARKMLEVLRRIEVELAGQAVERPKAAKEVLGDSLEAVYVVGSVAENKVAVYSNIDVAIVVDNVKLKSLETVNYIELKAEDLGLSLEAPVDIKMLTEEFRNILRKTLHEGPRGVWREHEYSLGGI